ncbi:hypothetical protein HanRHA438_Chr13g0626951 [Helianthus annuus]|nr:hypothetical protein HanRHA438_Chr13g0626951 [Helianthus annuus]
MRVSLSLFQIHLLHLLRSLSLLYYLLLLYLFRSACVLVLSRLSTD